ncbi:putative quinol monooxygenase [Capilliphycus salinus ALCB114379]|uniref:putative quinol monooxygenase n=1 Tax=Capilliphycus salinus TaxID=2768948 RepID=UPI0039A674B6
MKQTLRVVARIIALPDQVEPVKAVLSELIEPTRQEPGCIQYELLQNRAAPTDFTFVETWESEAALETHLASAHLQVATEKLQGLIATPPDIRRYDLVL